MHEIHNITSGTIGIHAGGAKRYVKPGETVNLELSGAQAVKLAKMGCAVKSAAAPIYEVSEKEPQISDAFTKSLDSMDDDELRAMAKANGLSVHHKAGRAKLIEALSGDTE